MRPNAVSAQIHVRPGYCSGLGMVKIKLAPAPRRHAAQGTHTHSRAAAWPRGRLRFLSQTGADGQTEQTREILLKDGPAGREQILELYHRSES